MSESAISKQKMIFLPGKLCDQRVWQRQIEHLSSLIEPVVVDLRYFATLDEMLNAILQVCTEPSLLAGFSMGGYVAQEFILRHPEKITGLALVGCSAKGYTEDEKKAYSKLIDAVKQKKTSFITEEALYPFVSVAHREDRRLMHAIVTMAKDAGDEVFIRQQTATLNRMPRYNDLKNITCPALVVGGVDDDLVNLKDVELTAKSLKHAEFHAIKNSGHMIPFEQTTILNDLLYDWIIHLEKNDDEAIN